MSTNTMIRRLDQSGEYASTRHRAVDPPTRALDKSTIAAVPATLIESMTREELLLLILAADVPLWRGQECEELLSLKDDEVLRRMAYLARQCCQSQLNLPIHMGAESGDGVVTWSMS